ncbi:MAG: hypothetical protein ACKO4K_03250 [Flavobacteriales bacterium]
MFSSILKKKLSEDQVSNIFINGLFDAIDRGFECVAGAINDDSCFVNSPSIDPKDINEFALIVIAGNIIELERLFDGHSGNRLLNLVYDKLAGVYKLEEMEIRQIIQEYKAYMKRVNVPSKTTLYAMSKAVFHKYALNGYQDDYFKRMNTPNPIFLKRLDELMNHFLFNWDVFLKKYRV